MVASPQLSRGLIAILAFISAVGPLATDMYLPAFTDISRDLSAGTSAVQLTLTTFMLGLGTGQLILGPLSDRWGRRRVLRIALLVFAASSIAIVFTPNIGVFIALRGVQGLAGSGGIVLARAIIADLAEGAEALRALSFMAMLVAIAPLLAPLAGGTTAEHWGWRAVLGIVATLTVAMLVLAWRFVPETLPEAQRHTGGVVRTLGSFHRLFRNLRFMMYALLISCTFGGLLAYISASPFVGQSILGMSPTQYSIAFAASAGAMGGANLLNNRLAGRVPPTRVLLIGGSLVLLGALAMGLQVLTGTLGVPGFIAAAFALSGGTGLVMPTSQALALAQADFARGAGSALLGAAQFFSGALTSPVVGAWGERTAIPMAAVLLIAGILAFACAVIAVRAARAAE